jgi:lariat debranching enzyme
MFWYDRATQLEMEDCRQFVSSRLQERGTKPFEFTQTAPPFDPTQSGPNGSFSGNGDLLLHIIHINSS